MEDEKVNVYTRSAQFSLKSLAEMCLLKVFI